MSEKEQIKPLAPAAFRLRSDEDEDMSMELKVLRKRKYIKCCGCITALLLIQAVTIIILFFTVFRIKNPVMKMNAVTVQSLELNGTNLRAGTNMTLVADVSVKNPNVASFKFSNTTTTLYYDGIVVGEARTPSGKAKAQRTLRMNVTVDIIALKILGVRSLRSDVMSSGALTMSSYTRIDGRVKILNIIKKHVDVKMNCTMTINLMTKAIEDQKCKRHV